MNIRIVCVGKLKERYLAEACGEYMKRLSRYARAEIIEVPDEKTPDTPSEGEKRAVLGREGARILAKLDPADHVIALAIKGRSFSSEELAARLDALMSGGTSRIALVIGGSLGLSGEVLERADETVSFSRLTFPHQLMRVILLEQIYRAFRIIRKEPYHK